VITEKKDPTQRLLRERKQIERFQKIASHPLYKVVVIVFLLVFGVAFYHADASKFSSTSANITAGISLLLFVLVEIWFWKRKLLADEHNPLQFLRIKKANKKADEPIVGFVIHNQQDPNQTLIFTELDLPPLGRSVRWQNFHLDNTSGQRVRGWQDLELRFEVKMKGCDPLKVHGRFHFHPKSDANAQRLMQTLFRGGLARSEDRLQQLLKTELQCYLGLQPELENLAAANRFLEETFDEAFEKKNTSELLELRGLPDIHLSHAQFHYAVISSHKYGPRHSFGDDPNHPE